MADNIKMEVKGDVLTITISGLKGKGTPSASGKSDTIASTRGNVSVADTGLKLGINLYRPKA